MSLFVLRFFIINCNPSVKFSNNSSSYSTDIIINRGSVNPTDTFTPSTTETKVENSTSCI